MFDLWTFKGLEALVSSGLGGGSLIYANVLIRKDAEWFVNEEGEDWPVTRADLDPHYDRVEPMLAPQRYPFDVEPYALDAEDAARCGTRRSSSASTGTCRTSRSRSPTRAQPPRPGDQIVDGDNLHGLPRFTCRLCGECDIGCNYGSKNTLDFNYLSRVRAAGRRDPDALRGAHVRAAARRRLRRPLRHARAGARGRADGHVGAAGADDDGRGSSSPRARSERRTCCCGTPTRSPAMSRTALGTRFCGNGDKLAFLTKSVRTDRGRRVGHAFEPSIGPVITSRIRYAGRERARLLHRGRRLPALRELAGRDDGRAQPPRPRPLEVPSGAGRKNKLGHEPESNYSAELSELLGDVRQVVGHAPAARDGPRHARRRDAACTTGYLEVDWTTKTSRAYFDSVKARDGGPRARARRALHGHAALVLPARDHRPPARRRADGPDARDRRRRPLRAGLRRAGPRRSPTARSCRARSARTRR